MWKSLCQIRNLTDSPSSTVLRWIFHLKTRTSFQLEKGDVGLCSAWFKSSCAAAGVKSFSEAVDEAQQTRTNRRILRLLSAPMVSRFRFETGNYTKAGINPSYTGKRRKIVSQKNSIKCNSLTKVNTGAVHFTRIGGDCLFYRCQWYCVHPLCPRFPSPP